MTWIVKRKIADLRAGIDPIRETIYFLAKDGSWTTEYRRAKPFTNLHAAEDVAKAFGEERTSVEPSA